MLKEAESIRQTDRNDAKQSDFFIFYPSQELLSNVSVVLFLLYGEKKQQQQSPRFKSECSSSMP